MFLFFPYNIVFCAIKTLATPYCLNEIALLLFLGFFQAADTSSANFDAYMQAMTTAQDCRLADSNRELLSGV